MSTSSDFQIAWSRLTSQTGSGAKESLLGKGFSSQIQRMVLDGSVPVAVKILDLSGQKTAKRLRAEYEKEVAVFLAINNGCPEICRFYGSGIDESAKRAWLVLERADLDAFTLLQQETSVQSQQKDRDAELPSKYWLYILRSAARGLAFLHSLGYYH